MTGADAHRGIQPDEPGGKLSRANWPWCPIAAVSYASAASRAVPNAPRWCAFPFTRMYARQLLADRLNHTPLYPLVFRTVGPRLRRFSSLVHVRRFDRRLSRPSPLMWSTNTFGSVRPRTNLCIRTTLNLPPRSIVRLAYSRFSRRSNCQRNAAMRSKSAKSMRASLPLCNTIRVYGGSATVTPFSSHGAGGRNRVIETRSR